MLLGDKHPEPVPPHMQFGGGNAALAIACCSHALELDQGLEGFRSHAAQLLHQPLEFAERSSGFLAGPAPVLVDGVVRIPAGAGCRGSRQLRLAAFAAAIMSDHVIRQVCAASDSARRRCSDAWLLPPVIAMRTSRPDDNHHQPTLEQVRLRILRRVAARNRGFPSTRRVPLFLEVPASGSPLFRLLLRVTDHHVGRIPAADCGGLVGGGVSASEFRGETRASGVPG